MASRREKNGKQSSIVRKKVFHKFSLSSFTHSRVGAMRMWHMEARTLSQSTSMHTEKKEWKTDENYANKTLQNVSIFFAAPRPVFVHAKKHFSVCDVVDVEK